MTESLRKEQFMKVFEENLGIIIKISGAYTKTSHDRQDLINDITLELWRSFSHFEGKSKVSTWIYRVALNTSMNYRRKQKNSALFLPTDFRKGDSICQMIETESTPELDLLYRSIDDLNEINKALILLYLDGNSYDEIAEVTGISKTNVGTRISRIKEQLKNSVQSKIWK